MTDDWTGRIITGVIAGIITSIIVVTFLTPAVVAALRQLEEAPVAVSSPIVVSSVQLEEMR